MSANKWRDLLAGSAVVLADGAMGTMLSEAGLQPGMPPEPWNVEHGERVAVVHRAYLRAGSRLILTNTFGANRFRLKLHNLEGRVAEFNRAGAACAQAAAADGMALIAGDIGPSGMRLALDGPLAFADAVAGFGEQAAGLIEGGADILWIETMSNLEEVRAAMEGIRTVSSSIPIVATMTFESPCGTRFGVTPEQAATALSSWGAAAVGGNCGTSPDAMIEVVRRMRAAVPDAILVAKPSAGIPAMAAGRPVWAVTPKEMAVCATALRESGVRIVGGCCGTTPDHIKAMADSLGLS